jgi:hypothetical protein
MDSEFLGQKRNRLEEENYNNIIIKEENIIVENKEKEIEIKIEAKSTNDNHEIENNTNTININNYTNIYDSNLPSNLPSNFPININIRNDEIKPKEEKNQYPNLSPERRKYLKSLINKLEISSNLEFSDKNISPEEKSRKLFRNSILYSLVIYLK